MVQKYSRIVGSQCSANGETLQTRHGKHICRLCKPVMTGDCWQWLFEERKKGPQEMLRRDGRYDDMRSDISDFAEGVAFI